MYMEICFVKGLRAFPRILHLFFNEKGNPGGQHSLEIDSLRAKRVKVIVRGEDNELVVEENPLISTLIRAMVDNIPFVSTYTINPVARQERAPLFSCKSWPRS